jgi:uncharacterized membrane protein YfcA
LNVRRNPGTGPALIGGALSGFAAGIIGTGGAMRALFLHHYVPDKDGYIGTSALIGLMIDISRIPVYLTEYPADATSGILPATIATVVAGLLGVFTARALLKNVSTERFQRTLSVALAAAGVMFIVQGIRD